MRKGQRTATIVRHLQEQGIVRDEYVPLAYLEIVRHGESIKAGIYEFSRPISAADVVEKLIRGDVILKTITVREGLDRFAIGRIFAADGFGRVAEWDKLTANPELIHDLAAEAKTLEGYLFPDTYKLTPGTPASKIVQLMVSNFRKHFGPQMPFITTGLGLHQTVTLASIVESEAKLPQERPLVASVYLNRLQRHMLLGADPTVIYSLKLANRWYGNIHNRGAGEDEFPLLRRTPRWLPRVCHHDRGAQPQRAEVSGAVVSRSAGGGGGGLDCNEISARLWWYSMSIQT